MVMTRVQMIALGETIPSATLTEWSKAIHGLAVKYLARLSKRGATPGFLGEIEKLNVEVPKLETTQEVGKKDLSASTDDVERDRDDAYDLWREARESAKVEFGTEPDALARFRTGVHVGGSAPLLVSEIRFLVPVLRATLAQLGWLGLNEEFVKRGEALADKLEASNTIQEVTRKGLPPKTAELYLNRGRLYDLTRKLVRIGRLEFRKEPEMAKLFNYEIVRRTQNALRAARNRPGGPGAKPAK